MGRRGETARCRDHHRRHPGRNAQRQRRHGQHSDQQRLLLVLEQHDGRAAARTYPAHSTAEHEAVEKPVTGSATSQAQAAAVKAVGSGTAGDVTTDVSGNGYEVTVTTSDGSTVEVHVDSSFNLDDHSRISG
jgi:hypothetical protein